MRRKISCLRLWFIASFLIVHMKLLFVFYFVIYVYGIDTRYLRTFQLKLLNCNQFNLLNHKISMCFEVVKMVSNFSCNFFKLRLQMECELKHYENRGQSSLGSEDKIKWIFEAFDRYIQCMGILSLKKSFKSFVLEKQIY